MKIVVVGSGKLANAILTSSHSSPAYEVLKWEDAHLSVDEKTIVIHAGSGRQLPDCTTFCERTDSVLIELSTGLETEKMEPNFTLIVCPNTSILLLKVMHMLQKYGAHFKNDKIALIESHQSSKKSVPGTAFSLATSLQFPVDGITSIRDIATQADTIGIPSDYLDKHAYHKIVIEDGLDKVTIETKVLGHDSYAKGVSRIVAAVLQHPLEKRRYSIVELIDKNLL